MGGWGRRIRDFPISRIAIGTRAHGKPMIFDVISLFHRARPWGRLVPHGGCDLAISLFSGPVFLVVKSQSAAFAGFPAFKSYMGCPFRPRCPDLPGRLAHPWATQGFRRSISPPCRILSGLPSSACRIASSRFRASVVFISLDKIAVVRNSPRFPNSPF